MNRQQHTSLLAQLSGWYEEALTEMAFMYICWHYTNWCTHQTAHCKTTWFKLGSTAVFIFICIPPTRYEVMHKWWKDTTVITKINDFLQVRVQSVVPIGPCPQFQVKQMGLYFSDSKHRFKKNSTNLCFVSLRCHWKAMTGNPHFLDI